MRSRNLRYVTVRAEALIRRITPDLSGAPLYIWPEPLATVDGRFLRNGDLAIQEQLIAAGRWRGRGPALFISYAAVDRIAFDHSDFERRFIGVCLHELAHWLDREPPAGARQLEPVERPAPEKIEAACRSLATKPPEGPCRLRALNRASLSHGQSFARLCVHLWWRAAHGGGRILSPHHLVFGSTYRGLEWQPTPAELIDTLGDEMRRLRALPLREVLGLDPSPQFVDLWDTAMMQAVDDDLAALADAKAG